MRQSKANRSHHRHKMEFEHTIRRMATKGCHHNEQAIFIGISLADVVDDGHVIRLRSFQIVRSLIANFHQQGRWFTIDESKDTLVHFILKTGNGPVKPRLKHIQLPKTCIVALSSNHLTGTNHSSNISRQIISPSYMSAEHRDGIQAQTVNTHHSRIFVLVLDIWRYRPHADTHRPNEHKRIEILPALTNILTADDLCFILLSK